MIKMLGIFLLCFLFLLPFSYGANFGRYKYSNSPMLLQQQLSNTRMVNARRQARYNYYSNPTRNIRYPSGSSQYPNIERRQVPLTAKQRYSPEYYNRL